MKEATGRKTAQLADARDGFVDLSETWACARPLPAREARKGDFLIMNDSSIHEIMGIAEGEGLLHIQEVEPMNGVRRTISPSSRRVDGFFRARENGRTG